MFYNLSEFNKEAIGECDLDFWLHHGSPPKVLSARLGIRYTDENGIEKIKLMETEKKQSGYQKLKAENEELKQRIEALKEQLAKYEPAPDQGEAVA